MEKSNRVKNILIVIAIFLIIAIVVTTVFKREDDNSKATDGDGEVTKVTHFSYDNLFAIEAPSTWEEVSQHSLNDKAIIELNDEENCSYVIAVMTSKKDFNGDFAAFKKRVFEQKEQYYETEIASYKQTTIDNHDAEYGEIYYTDPNSINTYIRSYAIETDNYFGQIVIWTLASNEKKVTKEFDDITASFVEIKVDKN